MVHIFIMDNSTEHAPAIFTVTSLDPITNAMRIMFQLVNYAIICGIISLFGMGANTLNICVFVKQGFKDSINISLMGLAISDLACSITMFYTSFFYYPQFNDLGFPFDPIEFVYITGGWPHVWFNRITSSITAFITLERCLCIAMPLKVKTILTPLRTKVIIVSIFLSTILLISPFYFVNRLEWKYNHSQNRSLLGITFKKHREIVESVTSFIHSVFLSTLLLICVAICTIILVVKLNQKTKWREASVAQTTTKPETITLKDKKVVKMITLISLIFIACYIPPTVIFLVMVFCREFSMTGMFQNLFYSVWSVSFILEAINSSVNIVVYLNMSSKFRVTLFQIFSRASE